MYCIDNAPNAPNANTQNSLQCKSVVALLLNRSACVTDTKARARTHTHGMSRNESCWKAHCRGQCNFRTITHSITMETVCVCCNNNKLCHASLDKCDEI